MNKYLLNIFLILLILSCDKYLDEQPDDRLEIDSLEKAQELVGNSYSSASHAFTDWYTDQVNSNIPGQFNISDYHHQAYQWEDMIYIWQDSPTYYWNNAYEAIAHANQALISIEKFSDDKLDKEQQRKVNAIKSEAYLCRAYHHFMLVNLFAKHYNQATASSDLGVPYVREPETEFLKSYKRNTVKEVYDFVEEDLINGLELLDESFFIGTKKFHFNKNAALAFASRYYLFKGDFDKCIEFSERLVGGNLALFIRDNNSVYNVPGGLNALEVAYGNPNLKANLLLAENFSWYQRKYNGFALNRGEINTFFIGPLNSSSYYDSRIQKGGVWSYSNAGATIPRLREYFYKPTITSDSGLAYVLSILFTGEEVVLNLAESYWIKNDDDKALEILNAFAKQRYYGQTFDFELLKSYYKKNNNHDALLEAILHERNKEFFMYGLRWFDIRRYDIPIVHKVYNKEGEITDTFSLPSGDLRRVLQIPIPAIDSGMKPNPR